MRACIARPANPSGRAHGRWWTVAAPDCGRPVELVKEESYFLRMSKYQDWLIDYIEKHPEFIQPVSRAMKC